MNLMSLMAELSLDGSGFQKGLQDAEKQGKSAGSKLEKTFNRIGTAIKAAFSVIAIRKVTNEFWGLLNSVATFGDTIDKQSQQLGMSRRAYQEWDYILGQNGASIDDMTMSMKTMNAQILSGSEESKKAFKSLGADIDMLAAMPMENQFDYLVQLFQQMPASAEKMALATQLFGRNGQALMPLLNQTRDSTNALRQEAEDLGLIMSDEDVDASVAFGDALDALKKSFTALRNNIGAKLLPTLTKFFTNATSYIKKLRGVYKENGLKGVFSTIAQDLKITWPTWDEVKEGAEKLWKSIKDNVAKLGNTLGGWVFGKKSDGSVDWPTWDDIKKGAEDLWKTIKQKVAALADTLGGWVFGRKEDGSVAWPTWDDIKAGAESLWESIKTNVANIADTLGGLVFGRAEDGSVAWPTWDDVQGAANALWEDIKEGVASFGGLIFGRDSEGKVNWPTLGELIEIADSLWEELCGYVGGLVGMVFGLDTEATVKVFEDLAQWIPAIGAAIATYQLVENIQKLGGAIKDMFSGNPLSGFNKWSTILAGIAALSVLIYENWDDIGPFFKKAGEAIDEYILQPLQEFFQPIADWVIDNIIEPIGSVIDAFTGKPEGTWFNKHFGNGSSTEEPTKTETEITTADVISEAASVASRVAKNGIGGLAIPQEHEEMSATEQKMLNYVAEQTAGVNNLGNSLTVANSSNAMRNISQNMGKGYIDAISKAYEWIKKTTGEEMWSWGGMMENITGQQKDVASSGGTPTTAYVSAEDYYAWKKAAGDSASSSEKAASANDKQAQSAGNASDGLDAVSSASASASDALGGLSERVGGMFWSSDDGSHASGLWTVPYDNYIARLHRGERVLTASQTRHAGEGSMSTAEITRSIKEAMGELIGSMNIVLNNKTVGKAVGDSVTNRVNTNISWQQRRTAFGHGG